MPVRTIIAALVAGGLALAGASRAQATSLQVSPSTLDVAAPGATATVTLRNVGREPVDVQLRVLGWSQSAGVETLAPTVEAVASPPAVTLAPNTDYVARLVRVSRQPVEGERALRLLIDEVPSQRPPGVNTVRIAIRYSIPVFFGEAGRTPPSVAWRVVRQGGKLFVEGTNKGGSRLRVAGLTVADAAGRSIRFGEGLTGYVLARSTMRFEARSVPQGFSASGVASVTAQGNSGPIRATAPIQRER